MSAAEMMAAARDLAEMCAVHRRDKNGECSGCPMHLPSVAYSLCRIGCPGTWIVER